MHSAFNSAGQRCSALRVLCIQQSLYADIERLLLGAMEHWETVEPWELVSDCGPVIDEDAYKALEGYIAQRRDAGQLLYQSSIPQSANGYFISPSLIRLSRINELEQEWFGPILQICAYQADELPQLIEKINA
jgi:RHH-type proline utilization regulon transcriptional repressor/proline dehydrogenase/delta 1-pyrroline-5-carboxylate dehydrogenase